MTIDDLPAGATELDLKFGNDQPCWALCIEQTPGREDWQIFAHLHGQNMDAARAAAQRIVEIWGVATCLIGELKECPLNHKKGGPLTGDDFHHWYTLTKPGPGAPTTDTLN